MAVASLIIAIATLVISGDDSVSCIDTLCTLGGLCSGSGVFEGLREVERWEVEGPEGDQPLPNTQDTDLADVLQQLLVIAKFQQNSVLARTDYIEGLGECLDLCAAGEKLSGYSGCTVLHRYQAVTGRDMSDPFSYGATLVHLVMVHGLRDRWWAAEFGRRGVAELASMRDLTATAEHVQLLAWAQARVSSD